MNWSSVFFANPDIVGAVVKAGAAIVDHVLADLVTEKAAEDLALLDVARAKAGHIKLLSPTCCFSTIRTALHGGDDHERCGRAAPRFFAREIPGGPELALCDEHAERVRAWLLVIDRTPPLPVRLYDPETS